MDGEVTKEEFLENGPSVFCTDAANCDIDEDYVWGVYEEFDYADDGVLYEEEFMAACYAIVTGWTPPDPSHEDKCMMLMEKLDKSPPKMMISKEEF
jgi:hypothetical protein